MAVRTPRQAKPAIFEPWAPPADVTVAEVAAVKALASGTATDEQQRRAMKFIVERVCGTYEEVYCPGDDGNRDTAYAAGKRRVGLYLVTLTHADIKRFKDDLAPREQG